MDESNERPEANMEANSVVLSEELIVRARAEAKRSSASLQATIETGLRRYLDLQDGVHGAEEAAGDPDAPMGERLARAMAATGTPNEGVEAAAAVLLEAVGLAPRFREGRTVYEYVDGLLQWAAAAPDHGLGCVLVTSQTPSGDEDIQQDAVISYARGYLQATKAGLSGELEHLFSDRLAGTAPFDPNRRDLLDLNVALDWTTGMVTLELVAHSWNDARQTLTNLDVRGGVVIGEGASVGNLASKALYALSFSRTIIPG